jgi:CRP-like cAMP-binding protein
MEVVSAADRLRRELSHVPFFASLPARDRERLAARSRLLRLTRGECLWRLGDGPQEFMFVLRGRVKLATSGSDGHGGIVNLRDAGQLVCGGATCAGTPYCCTALVHGETLDVVVVAKTDLLAALAHNPDACRAFLADVASCTMALCGRVNELTGGAVDRRLAMMLLRLADRVGEARPDGTVWIPIRLSRQDLAELCNTVPETATRAMGSFRRAEIVYTRPRGFLVRDRCALQRVADGHDR